MTASYDRASRDNKASRDQCGQQAARAAPPVMWPDDITPRAHWITTLTGKARGDAVTALVNDCAPMVRALVTTQCRRTRAMHLVEDAEQNAMLELFQVLSGIPPTVAEVRAYLRGVVLNAVTRTTTGGGSLHPTAAQRRAATLTRARADFLTQYGTAPTDEQLMRFHNEKMTRARANAHDQGALVTLDEVRAHGVPTLSLDYDTPGRDHASPLDPASVQDSDDNLALDPLDTGKLERLIVEACADVSPLLDGRAFARSVLTARMYSTVNESALAVQFGVSRHTVRSAHKKVWEIAAVVAHSMGITGLAAVG